MNPLVQIMKRVIQTVLCVIIKIYQIVISPLFPPVCRHIPSCSVYTRHALQTHGLKYGLKLSLKRIATCHPWGRWGFDPVPEKQSSEHSS